MSLLKKLRNKIKRLFAFEDLTLHQKRKRVLSK